MGVDCKTYLPPNVRIRDVANILGIAAGLKPHMYQSEQFSDSSWAEVNGVSVSGSGIVTLANIDLRGDMVDGMKHHFVSYHFEASHSGDRLLMPRSTAFWIACMKRLVDFYGGRIDFNDCDDTDVDYEVPPKSNEENCPEDGDEWDDFQKRVLAVEPVTKAEMEYLDGVAAYKLEEIRSE
jgi:hypothetical protein